MEVPMQGGGVNVRSSNRRPSGHKSDTKTNGEDTQRWLLQPGNNNNHTQAQAAVAPVVVAAHHNRSSGRPSNTTLPSLGDATNSSWTSSTAAANNFVHSFDDQGKAASYLQFFRSPNTTTTNTKPTTSNNTNKMNTAIQKQPQQQQFPFDVYSTDRTTRTPVFVAAGKQQQTTPKPIPTAEETSSESLLDSSLLLNPGHTDSDEDDSYAESGSRSSSSDSSSCSSSSSSSSCLSSSVQHHQNNLIVRAGGTNSTKQNQGNTDNGVLVEAQPLPPTKILYERDRRTSPTMMVPQFLSPLSSSCSLYDDTNVQLDRSSLEPVVSTNARSRSPQGDTTTIKNRAEQEDLEEEEEHDTSCSISSSHDESKKENQTLVCLERQYSFNSSASSTSRSVRFHPSTKMATLSVAHNHMHHQPITVPSSLLGKSHSDHDDEDDDDEKSISILSSRSHLFGESISVSHPRFLQSSTSRSSFNSNSRALYQQRTLVNSATLSPQSGQSLAASLPPPQQQTWWNNAWSRLRNECRYRLPVSVTDIGAANRFTMLPLHRKTMSHNQHNQSRHHPMPLSPRSRNLADLQYLTQQHKQKVQQITYQDGQHFDFVLVLQPQEVYGFWAALLDFRVELLGEEVVQAMEEHWRNCSISGSSSTVLLSDQQSSSGRLQCPTLTKDDMSRTESEDSTSSSSACFDEKEKEVNPMTAANMETPTTGVRRRRNNTTATSNKDAEEDDVATPLLLTTPGALTAMRRYSSSRRLLGAASPGLYSVGGTAGSIVGDTSLFTGGTYMQQPPRKQSMFERAVTTPLDNEDEDDDLDNLNVHPAESETRGDTGTLISKTNTAINTPATVYRRRWGNQQVHQNNSQHNSGTVSPPITSLAHRQLSSRKLGSVKPMQRTSAIATTPDSNKNKKNPTDTGDPNIMTEQDIPSQVIARGIAARTNRTNGMLPFLSALKRGIVLRRHLPNLEAAFCKLTSPDGGDTIVYQTVDADEAILALREQRVRYNHDVVDAQPWSLEPPTDATGYDENAPHNFSVPDYVAADAYRKRQAAKGKLLPKGQRLVSEWANKVAAHSKVGSAKIADVVAVHPARNKDPRADSSGALGSTTLRRSQSEFATNLTFSLVMRATKSRLKKHGNDNMEDLENKWHEGDGNETQFRYLDLEAATEGEYWLVFRGLLLLHRDAAVGRFAKQRAAGIGTNVDNIVRTLENAEHNRLHQDEFHEPVTVGWLEKMIVNCRDLDTTYMEGFVTKEGAVPPPSDYFLGFRSPGTTIWSRLRQAGLETCRVYSLDPNRVMIKIHCPYDRLMDVAEVLRIPVKTRDGSFTPFREDLMNVFDRSPDPLEGPTDDNPFYPDFQFRSSIRQNIIAFIIGSRIRDSGAELDPTGADELGQMVQARVPLHMHGKLNAIFEGWFYFWKAENWDRGGQRLMYNDQLTVDYGVAAMSDENNDKNVSKDVPGLFTRFFVGCMNQPLDSIEQYFGEKVAFYFTWLQHTAFHLVFLSIVGLFVFICQLATGNVDHPLRPFFAVVVMLWTFVVLINWKKRANFMAYRWGTLNYQEQETTRPQFKGNYMQDEITREWIVTYPKWKRWLKYCISFPLTLFFTGGTLMLILWVHGNRDAQLNKYFSAESSENFEFNFTLAAIGQTKSKVDMKMTKDKLLDLEFWIIMVGLPSMLGLCLPLLNFILMRLSIMLNDFENYRTESEYRTYLIIKVFSFRFICYFATLYYYAYDAFVSVGSDDLAIQSGLIRVGTGVLVYTTVAQWWQYILHVCFPILIRKIRMHHRRQRLTNELRTIELEEEDINRLSVHRIDKSLLERQARLINKRLLLDQAQDDIWLELMNPPHDSFPEYIQAVVQFTFVACFSVVLPITPLIVLFNYLISMRLDAYKLCRGRRRPLAEKTGGIGVWEHVLHIVAVISVLTNCWMIGFTWKGKEIDDLTLFALIVGWEHIMLLIKYVMSTSMSTLPKSVRDAMKREQYELDQQRNTLMHERRQQHFDDEDGLGSSMRFHHRKSVTPSGHSSMRFRSKFDKAVADEEDQRSHL